MFGRNLIKLLVVNLVVFTAVLQLSVLRAQSKSSESKSSGKDQILDLIYEYDSLFTTNWHQNQIPFGLRDSLKPIITDPSFEKQIFLIGNLIGGYAIPFQNKVTSRFGPRRYRYHYGTDINLNTGDTVRAAFDGKVRIAKTHYGYGKTVVLRHLNGLETVYGHFSKILVDTNEIVEAGQPIGLGGNTGRSYGSHLHFEMRYNGIPFNAETIFDFEEGKLLSDTLVLTAAHFRYMGGHSGGGSSSGPSPTAVAKYHKVKSGECLSVIAQKHNTTVNRLCQLNNISRTTVLQIGRTLRVR